MKYLVFSLLILLGACGGAPKNAPVTTQPYSDAALRETMTAYFASGRHPAASRYLHHRTDLNGDGINDAIVLMRGPYGHWCSVEGCTMFIAQAKPSGGFEVISQTNPVRGPVCVLGTQVNGWRNLIVRVAGRAAAPKVIMLQNKGNGYPANPHDLTPILGTGPQEGICAFQAENGTIIQRTLTPSSGAFQRQGMSSVDRLEARLKREYEPLPPFDPNEIPYRTPLEPNPYETSPYDDDVNNTPFVNEYDPANAALLSP